MPIQFELPPMALLGPLLAAVGIYGLLRWVVWLLGTQTVPAEMWEATAAAVGYVLVAAAVLLSLIRVSAFGPRSSPAARRAPVEPAR
ncbi:hypothetical protein [Arthrobacter globiformis]|uniref:hypothetical protein n=1 Tax=Arthrobacter globiformis TaxID=1665 RepID=UPI002793411B|nr:hypothetical protein [Arthrobacter globiformis]MDQ0619878.1 formate hydrogenlyase subunit 3/multisubunit Na+/H+ antiporter MnhD subunit [Arthrobacter globiformis]